MDLESIKSKIRAVQDWPKQGIAFYDITPLLEDADGFKFVIDEFARVVESREIDKVVGIDARGFILASALAYKLGKGLAIVRKKGKLPPKTIGKSYNLEYAADCLEMRADAVKPGEKILVVDDVLATGGTMETSVNLIKKLGGGVVSILFLIELSDLKGREKLKKEEVRSLITY